MSAGQRRRARRDPRVLEPQRRRPRDGGLQPGPSPPPRGPRRRARHTTSQAGPTGASRRRSTACRSTARPPSPARTRSRRRQTARQPPGAEHLHGAREKPGGSAARGRPPLAAAGGRLARTAAKSTAPDGRAWPRPRSAAGPLGPSVSPGAGPAGPGRGAQRGRGRRRVLERGRPRRCGWGPTNHEGETKQRPCSQGARRHGRAAPARRGARPKRPPRSRLRGGTSQRASGQAGRPANSRRGGWLPTRVLVGGETRRRGNVQFRKRGGACAMYPQAVEKRRGVPVQCVVR